MVNFCVIRIWEGMFFMSPFSFLKGRGIEENMCNTSKRCMGLESRPPGSSVKEGEMVTQQDLLLESATNHNPTKFMESFLLHGVVFYWFLFFSPDEL